MDSPVLFFVHTLASIATKTFLRQTKYQYQKYIILAILDPFTKISALTLNIYSSMTLMFPDVKLTKACMSFYVGGQVSQL